MSTSCTESVQVVVGENKYTVLQAVRLLAKSIWRGYCRLSGY